MPPAGIWHVRKVEAIAVLRDCNFLTVLCCAMRYYDALLCYALCLMPYALCLTKLCLMPYYDVGVVVDAESVNCEL